MRNDWLYALACVAFPVLWGLVIVRVTRIVEKVLSKRPRRREETAATESDTALSIAPDYYI